MLSLKSSRVLIISVTSPPLRRGWASPSVSVFVAPRWSDNIHLITLRARLSRLEWEVNVHSGPRWRGRLKSRALSADGDARPVPETLCTRGSGSEDVKRWSNPTVQSLLLKDQSQRGRFTCGFQNKMLFFAAYLDTWLHEWVRMKLTGGSIQTMDLILQHLRSDLVIKEPDQQIQMTQKICRIYLGTTVEAHWLN